MTTLKALYEIFFANILAEISKGAFRVAIELVYRYKYVLNLRIKNSLNQHKNHFTPPRRYKQTFVDFLQKYLRII